MATLLIGYDTESAAVGEGLARFLGPEVPQYRARSTRRRPAAGSRCSPACTRSSRRPCTFFVCGRTLLHALGRVRAARRVAAVRHPAAHLQPRRLPRCALPPERRRARGGAARDAGRRAARGARLHLRADPEVPRPRVRRPADAVRLLPRPARPARPARDRRRDRPPLRHLLGPQRAERQPDAVGAAVRLRRRRLPRHPRDPVPVLARRHLVRRPRLRRGTRVPARRSKGAIDEIVEHDLVFATAFHEWCAVEANEEGHGLDPRPARIRAGARRRDHELHRLLGKDGRNTSWSCRSPRRRCSRRRDCTRRYQSNGGSVEAEWTITDAACQSTSLVVGRAVDSGGEAHERGEIGWHATRTPRKS